MEEYKQRIIEHVLPGSKTMEDVHNFILSNSDDNITYNLNENGLHSRYMGSHYEPAIIKQTATCKVFIWLFDGDARDCDHPCYMLIRDGQINLIVYYSSKKIMTFNPISLLFCDRLMVELYNRYMLGDITNLIKILDGFDNPTGTYKITSKILLPCTPEFYPLCNQMEEDIVRFKFAD